VINTLIWIGGALVFMVFRAAGLTYRRVPARRRNELFTGPFTRVISNDEAAASTHPDGTVTLTPHCRWRRRAVYFYGPHATHRGVRWNHKPHVRIQPISAIVTVEAADLKAAAGGRRIGLRPWDQAVAIYGPASLHVSPHVQTGVTVQEWKATFRTRKATR